MADKITQNADGSLNVPDEPIIPFIEGDGTGVDIWPASQLVLDAAAAKYGQAQIAWKEVLAGEKAFNATGDWLPEETVEAFREYLIGIKGPLTTPIGGGIRIAQRRAAPDPRPLRVPAAGALLRGRALAGEAPRAGRHGDLPREHRGRLRRHRVEAGTPEAKKLIDFLHERVRLERSVPTRASASSRSSEFGSKRLIRAALAVRDRPRAQVGDAGAQGQHHEVHRGRVPRLGLRARRATSSATSPSAGTTAAASPATRSS